MPPYTFTEDDLQTAFNHLDDTLFSKIRHMGSTGHPEPRMLIVAGAQGSGKTHLLDHELLPSGRYASYIPLYLPAFRELHPQYAEMLEHGPLHAYEHTEAFIWALGGRVFEHAFAGRYNIIMETALDDPQFADFPPAAVAAGYVFEVHLIACQKEFGHWSTLHRAVKSVANNQLERFVPLSRIEASQANAKAILDAFEEACTKTSGSEITLYRRGFDNDRNRAVLCHSKCVTPLELTPQPDYRGEGFVTGAFNRSVHIDRTPTRNAPCSYPQYSEVVHAGMIEAHTRRAMVNACCETLSQAQKIDTKVPRDTFRELCMYVLKYVHA